MEQALRPRVLIVDDDLSIRRGLHDLLEDYGVQVVGEAGDGLQALKMAVALLPDIVLMDLRMPLLGGLDATMRLTSILPEVRVIVCTAHTSETMCARAREMGAVAVVAKGNHPSEFLAAIRQAWTQIYADRTWEAAPSKPSEAAGGCSSGSAGHTPRRRPDAGRLPGRGRPAPAADHDPSRSA